MASNTRSSSGGVRSLRAMFETGNSTTEDSTSPPPRGRSPASESVVSNGSARPLSTVRTSFVAVERGGQLKKINGDGGVEGKVDAKIGAFNKDKPKEDSTEAMANGKNNTLGNDVVGEAAEKPASSGGEKPALLPTDAKGKAVAYDSAAVKEQSPHGVDGLSEATALSAAEIPLPDTPKPAERLKTRVSTKSKAPAPVKGVGEKVKEKSASTKPAATKPKENSSRSSLAPISVSRDTTATKPTVKAPISAPAPATKPTAKLPKTPTTPSKPSHLTMATVKPRVPPATTTEPTKAPIKKPSRSSMAPPAASASSSVPKPRIPASSSSTPLSKQALQPSPKSKANHRSPTRPARFPTSITAPTASSAAKTSNNPPSRPHSRSSSSLRPQRSTIQKVSPTRPTTTASVRRQSSRPSLPDRPHSRNAVIGRKSLSGSTAAPDDGFLARMMRPTASSASKTLEKAQEKIPEKGDTRIVRKVKNAIKGESAVIGEGKKDQHPGQAGGVGAEDSKDAEEYVTPILADEIEEPAIHREEIPPVVEVPGMEESDKNTIEDAPPATDVVTELPEVTPIVATAL
ncbi:MAG: hypothetical protein M1840_006416 [Geoglossum simile]|nr:MAG: hypothetical protein M1840_006416 [Geoglossum simile]